MIKKLRRRLALIFTGLTGLVLALVLGFSLWYALQQNTQTHMVSFQADNDLVLSGVATGQATGNWLAGMEAERDVVVSVRLNGEAIAAARSADEEDEREVLFQTVQQQLDEEHAPAGSAVVQGTGSVFSVAVADAADGAAVADGATANFYQTAEMQMLTLPALTATTPEGEQYWTMATAVLAEDLSTGSAQPLVYDVIVLKSLEEANRQALFTGLGYAGLFLAGLAVLLAVNYFLAGLVLKPTAESLRQQSEFVAAASHELRTPLAVVKNCAHTGRAAQTAAEAERCFGLVDAEATRMARLVNDLLILAGSESGRWDIQQSQVDLDALLIEAADSLAGLGIEKGVELRLELPEEPLGQLNGDADRLTQVLRVLVDNAMEYSPPGGQVTLGAKVKKGGVEITVADQGPGIDDEDKRQVFHRFYRGDKSRSDKAHFGLGLPVAKELVEMHGGGIRALTTPGGGATLAISFPAALFRHRG